MQVRSRVFFLFGKGSVRQKRFVKAFIIFVVVMLFLGGAAVGYLGWKKWTKPEYWGMRVPLQQEVTESSQKTVEEHYNKILDEREILAAAVEKHSLVSFYKVGGEEAAIERLREDSIVTIHQGKFLDFLVYGPRNQRDFKAEVSETLAQLFMEEVR